MTQIIEISMAPIDNMAYNEIRGFMVKSNKAKNANTRDITIPPIAPR